MPEPHGPQPQGEDRKVKFHFEYDQGYRLIGANGVWSGITTRGDIKLDFFVESIGVPEQVTHLINEAGSLGAELTRLPEQRIVRRMQVGVLLSLEQAESIADFIKGQIMDFKKRTGKGE